MIRGAASAAQMMPSASDRRSLLLVLLLAVSFLLAGCAAPNPQSPAGAGQLAPSTTMTLNEAKAITLERQDQIAALFPVDNTGAIVRPETSRSLYPCGEDDTFQWPGVTRVEIVGEVEPASVIGAIAAQWAGQNGWTVIEGTSINGFPRVTLEHDDGSSFVAGFYEGGAEFWVDAASPCFFLEGGLQRGAEY